MRDGALGKKRNNSVHSEFRHLLDQEIKLRWILEDADSDGNVSLRFMMSLVDAVDRRVDHLFSDLAEPDIICRSSSVDHANFVSFFFPHDVNKMGELLTIDDERSPRDVFRRAIEVIHIRTIHPGRK